MQDNAETVARTHRLRWFGIVPGTEPLDERKVPRNAGMAGRDWGWDVECSCGWQSRTGGATQASVRRKVQDHRWDVQHNDGTVT